MGTWARLGLLLAVALALAVLADGGPSAHAWSAPAPLNTNAISDSGNDAYPQVTTDGAGNWVAVWQSLDSLGGTIGLDWDILVARSTDNGATWTAPAALNVNATSDSGYDDYPQVTTDGGGNWVAVWYSSENLGGTIGTDGDILVARSTNNGAGWTVPTALNTNAASDSGGDTHPQVATDGTGHWVAVWDSGDDLGGTIGIDGDILVSRSTDNGVTWTAPAALNTNAVSDSRGDFRSQVTTDGGGNWVAVWHSAENLGGTIGTDNDILVSRSTDNGVTWTPPAVLNTNAATDLGADYYPQVTTDGTANWLAVWYSNENLGGSIGTDYDILVSRSTDNGASWTPPAALNTNGASDSATDEDPQVTTDGTGNWLAAWYSEENLGGTIGTDGDILVSRSADNGVSWRPPTTLNTNAASDSGHDYNPQVTADAGGNWVAVWTSEDSLGGSIGTDRDVLYAMCSPLDADCDGALDAADNCPDDPNPSQEDADSDDMGDMCDPCPTDPDCDDDSLGQGPSGGFFRDGVEAFIGTDPMDACADTSDANDETGVGVSPWPPDFNDNGLVDIGDLVALRNHWVPLGETYGARYDLNANGLCDIGDLVALRYYWVGSGYDTCTVG